MNHIVIEEEKLQHNIEIIKNKIKNINNNIKIIAVIKGNAYGMGMLLVAKKLIDNNIDFFAVSEIEEGKILRDNGYKNEILLLKSTCIKEEVEEIIKYNLIPSLGTKEAVDILDNIAKENDRVIEAHLKIDTGFGRYGFVSNENTVNEIIKAFENKENIKITGTYSHFSSSYANNKENTQKQYNLFLNIVNKLREKNFDVGILHICNTPAFFKYPEMYLDAVRIGSAFSGRVQIRETTGLQKVGYLESVVSEIKELPRGYKIGYSETMRLRKNTKIAIINAGYAEGIDVGGRKDSIRFIDILRKIKEDVLSLWKDNSIKVKINDETYKILGRISMKNIVVDITNSNVKIGDKVMININLLFADSKIPRINRLRE